MNDFLSSISFALRKNHWNKLLFFCSLFKNQIKNKFCFFWNLLILFNFFAPRIFLLRSSQTYTKFCFLILVDFHKNWWVTQTFFVVKGTVLYVNRKREKLVCKKVLEQKRRKSAFIFDEKLMFPSLCLFYFILYAEIYRNLLFIEIYLSHGYLGYYIWVYNIL